MQRQLEAMAVQYVLEELGWKRARVYGYQPDPNVCACAAVWLEVTNRQSSAKPRWRKVGLICHTEDGILEEFDPTEMGEPGELHASDKLDLLSMRVIR